MKYMNAKKKNRKIMLTTLKKSENSRNSFFANKKQRLSFMFEVNNEDTISWIFTNFHAMHCGT